MYNKIAGSRIFLTGGAGFIGSYIVEELIPLQPAKIIILDNLVRGSTENMKSYLDHPIVDFREGDIRDKDILEACIMGSDYVFHLAALRINACAANPAEGFEVMIRSTFDVAELCVKHKVKKLIFSSSASVYGLAQHFPTPESDHPYNNQTFYGGAKLWAEQLFRSYKYMYGLDYVALRYFNAYGPRMDVDGKYTEVMIKWLDCIRDQKSPVIFGDGSTTMDFVFVRDIARANIAALQSDVSDEAFNIGNSEETSLTQLLGVLLKVNNSALTVKFQEENTINPVSRRLADISKAQKLLGFTPSVTLEQGMKELSAWYFAKQKMST